MEKISWTDHVRNKEVLVRVNEQRNILHSGVPRNFFPGGGVQQIQLRTEGRQNGNLGAVAP